MDRLKRGKKPTAVEVRIAAKDLRFTLPCQRSGTGSGDGVRLEKMKGGAGQSFKAELREKLGFKILRQRRKL
jgi:hypothetical protein